MIFKQWFLVGVSTFVLAGCGGKKDDNKASAAGSNRAANPALDAMEHAVDKLCACKDVACATAAEAELNAQGDVPLPDNMTPTDTARFTAITTKIATCSGAALTGSGSGAPVFASSDDYMKMANDVNASFLEAWKEDDCDKLADRLAGVMAKRKDDFVRVKTWEHGHTDDLARFLEAHTSDPDRDKPQKCKDNAKFKEVTAAMRKL